MKTNPSRKKNKNKKTVDAKALRQRRAFGIGRRPGIGEAGHLEERGINLACECGGEQGEACPCRQRFETRLLGGQVRAWVEATNVGLQSGRAGWKGGARL